MVTTTADLTVVRLDDGVKIIFMIDLAEEPRAFDPGKRIKHSLKTRVLSGRDLEICYDRGRNLDHLEGDLPIVVRDTACAYLYLYGSEDASFRVYLHPVLRLTAGTYEDL